MLVASASSLSMRDRPYAASPRPPTNRSIVRKVAWRIMPLIMVCYLFAFFDRINISFAKFALQSDLGLSDTAYGFGAGLFVVGYVLFEVPSNLMLYKVGARRWIARIMVSWGIATALMVFVQTEWQFYVLRFLIGAMEAGFAPGVLFYLTLWFPVAYRGRITSTLFLASAFAGLARRARRRPRAVASGRRARHGGLALAVPGRRPALRGAGHPGVQRAEGPHSGRRLADARPSKRCCPAASPTRTRASAATRCWTR